ERTKRKAQYKIQRAFRASILTAIAAVALANMLAPCIIHFGMKQIHISELMPLVETARADLTDWTVGFVKAVETSKGNFAGVLAGSGVFVTGNGRHAILTANHVS